MIHINLFIGEVKKQLAIRKWRYKDLAKASGVPLGTIYVFMSGARDGETTKKALAKALNIEL